MDDIEIRNLGPSDYTPIIVVVDDWWGGRKMTHLLQKLFFVHFNDTSFVAEKNNELAGFLIGFYSQTLSNEGYIHFAGVNPEYRGLGIGRLLYNHFFAVMKQRNCTVVRCITSPVNKDSIEFHKSLGFSIQTASEEQSNPAVVEGYDGNGEDRVLFYKTIG